MAREATFNITQEMVDYVFEKHPHQFEYPTKAVHICHMRLRGHSYAEIGAAVGLGKERVRQYLKKVWRVYNFYRHKEVE